MHFFEKLKCWFSKNKKYILIGGTVALILISAGVGYVLCKDKKVSFSDWLKNAPTEDLKAAYEKLRTEEFCKTGTKPYEMIKIGEELGERGAKEWFEKHPPNTDPHFRWTDANRWDKD